MSNVLSRSWSVAQLSFRIMGQDKEILLFPLFGGIFSLLFTVAIFYPSILFAFQGEGDTPLQTIVIFLGYLVLAFIATFFNVCAVYTAKTRLEGGDATLMGSLRFALSKIGLIFAWSVVSATVGQLLAALDSAAENAGPIGKILLSLVTSILGLVWSVVTIFVVPAMVYYNLGPFDAIKVSIRVVKQTWGESLVRHYGLGLLQFLCLLLVIPIAVILFMTLGQIPNLLPVIILVPLLYVIATVLIFGTANVIFNTILFAYADGKPLPADIDPELLSGAFRPREGRA